MGIPVIDASALTGGSPEARLRFDNELLDGLSAYGFVKLVKHPIPDQEVEDIFDAVRDYVSHLSAAKSLHPYT